MMSKYSMTLDMSSNNSQSLILRNIKPNSKVLEFGPSNGYMTKYLKKELNCTVYIVEKDQDAGNEASQYADQYLIGRYGDIEKYTWSFSWSNIEFDYIIFADVLEHLYNPYNVLKAATNLLKKTGSILISIPNISHNSIIIDLINNKFEYSDLGLLDNTHIRFFTRGSLLNMVKDANLYVHSEINTNCAIEHTEFKNNYNDIDPAIANLLMQRADGDIYQFIWELKHEQK